MSDWKKRFDEAWKKNMPIRWFVPGIGALLIVLLHYTGASRSAESEPKVLYMLVWGLAGAVFILLGLIRLAVGMFKAEPKAELPEETQKDDTKE